LRSPKDGLILLDVHSGLGPSGIDTLMTNDIPLETLQKVYIQLYIQILIKIVRFIIMILISKIFKRNEDPRIIETFGSLDERNGASQGYELTIGFILHFSSFSELISNFIF
jgi:hypothetical protein